VKEVREERQGVENDEKILRICKKNVYTEEAVRE
jgi:hypothetical protein